MYREDNPNPRVEAGRGVGEGSEENHNMAQGSSLHPEEVASRCPNT